MTKLLPLILLAGCATILNKREVEVHTAPGVSVDGQTGSVTLDQREPHVVSYDGGGSCALRPGVSVGYIVLDIFLTGPIGLIIDGVTGNWTIAKGGCGGLTAD
jgi:hypothetical protein